MEKYIRFYCLILVFTLIPISYIGYFNYKIDPYGIWNSSIIFGENNAKSNRFAMNFIFKATHINYLKPKNIILGSSRVMIGIDPKHSSLSSSSEEISYNLGLTGANMYEIRKYFDPGLFHSQW